MEESKMESKTYSIFGAGAAGLYTAWRLLDGATKPAGDQSKLLAKGDTLALYDWGQYDFSKENPGTRASGARVCTWHYKNDKSKSYVELGGMRYAEWDSNPSPSFPNPNDGTAPGQRLVSTVISQLGLDQYSVPFNESANPLYYLRTKHLYLNYISATNPAPYFADESVITAPPDNGFNTVETDTLTTKSIPTTRKGWDTFYQHGRITANLPDTSIYKKGAFLKDIGYWNLMYDRLGSEGYNYTADGNGYTSNVINSHAGEAFQGNNEFTPGSEYKTLTIGYSGMFDALFQAIAELAQEKGVIFEYYPNTRLHSILQKDNVIEFGYATRDQPWTKAGSKTTDAAWLAMPRHAIELVARATRFEQTDGLDVLNAQKVKLYLESAIMQPSYKVGMFFKEPWWTDKAKFPVKLTSYELTDKVLQSLKQTGFPEDLLLALEPLVETPYDSADEFINTVQNTLPGTLTAEQIKMLISAAELNTIGPSYTDTPIRMVVYFGNNAANDEGEKVYGILASYDDEQFTTFWQELELGDKKEREIPISEDFQTLEGPRLVPRIMNKMLRKQLAEMHFGTGADYRLVPEPLESRYMDWSLPPFNAGYHAWAAHFNIGDVQQNIRKPSQLIDGADANIFIVGETYSNDQAWVEGAYCTAESVLNDFFDIEPIIDCTEYPFICSAS
jgi:hypothetical protein